MIDVSKVTDYADQQAAKRQQGESDALKIIATGVGTAAVLSAAQGRHTGATDAAVGGTAEFGVSWFKMMVLLVVLLVVGGIGYALGASSSASSSQTPVPQPSLVICTPPTC